MLGWKEQRHQMIWALSLVLNVCFPLSKLVGMKDGRGGTGVGGTTTATSWLGCCLWILQGTAGMRDTRSVWGRFCLSHYRIDSPAKD